jgi:nicotinate-nucleotide pyrophosphorylase (carboxylating)
MIDEVTEALITLALREDLGPAGDVTSRAVLGAAAGCTARIVAREPIVLSGLEVARAVFSRVDPQVRFSSHLPEGTRVTAGLALAEVVGPAASVLAAERTALNFLQRLCGVATFTARYVEKLEGTRCRLLDTRKTTPGFRALEKAAVRAGGGHNHRMGLYDGIPSRTTTSPRPAGCARRSKPRERTPARCWASRSRSIPSSSSAKRSGSASRSSSATT